jgi:acetoin utilization deacetylase AcuC-like enzyme
MTRALLGLAEEVCQGRLLVTLEGGYNLKGQRDGSLAVLSELRGGPLTDDDSEFYLDGELAEQFKNCHDSHDAIGRAIEAAGNHWNI